MALQAAPLEPTDAMGVASSVPPPTAAGKERQASPSRPDAVGGGSRSWSEGLELARACAVALVVYSHGQSLLSQSPTWTVLSATLGLAAFFKPGWWGVRIFFALSGFLIGRQVIGVLQQGSLGGGLHFVLRRWLRTVPTYWIVLAVLCSWRGIPWFSPRAVQNALFLQTSSIHSDVLGVLDVAWSLALEEWFYALMAMVVVLSAFAQRRPSQDQAARMVLVLALVIVCFSITMRLLVSGQDWLNWIHFRNMPILQLDSFSWGVAMASLEILRPRAFKALTTRPGLMAALTCFGMGGVGMWLKASFEIDSQPSGWELALFGGLGFPLANGLSCCFLAWLWPFRWSSLPAWMAHGLRVLAATSYSLYLVHLGVAYWVTTLGSGLDGLAAFGIYAWLSILLGWICWHGLERPLFPLRRRLRALGA
jgi:peptidoglycan/LPS O-acetylase OafA/YrhL